MIIFNLISNSDKKQNGFFLAIKIMSFKNSFAELNPGNISLILLDILP